MPVYRTTEFYINELSIVTKTETIDIRNIYKQLIVIDSIFMPSIHGYVTIDDANALTHHFIFDGSEALLIDISKEEGDEVNRFKRAFRLIKQASRSEQNFTKEDFVLHFISDEMVYSYQRRVTQSYDDFTYTEIARSIMSDYIEIPEKDYDGIYDASIGVRKVVVPNLRPIEAVEWCAKRALDENLAPSFLFFQNFDAYHFVSLSTLLQQEPIYTMRIELKNQNDEFLGSLERQLETVRSFDMLSQYDYIDRIKNGVEAGTFIGFDPTTRIIDEELISYDDHYDLIEHSNETRNLSLIQNRRGLLNTEEFESKKTLNVFNTAWPLSSYIQSNYPESIVKRERYENIIFQRRSIFKNFLVRKLRTTIPGNFNVICGKMIDVVANKMARLDPEEDQLDLSITAKYLTIGTKHIFGFDKYETIVDMCTSSNMYPLTPSSTPEQLDALLSY